MQKRYMFATPDGVSFWARTNPDNFRGQPDGPPHPFVETGFHPRHGAGSTFQMALGFLKMRIKSGHVGAADIMAREAFDQAEKFLAVARERGHMYDLPTLGELEEALPEEPVIQPPSDRPAEA